MGSGGVNINSTNTKTALNNVLSTLPTSTNPNQAAGQGAIPVLMYAICSDVSFGTKTSEAYVYFGVDTTDTVANQTANLIAAGVKIVNAYVGNLAVNGSGNPTIQNLYNQISAPSPLPSPMPTALPSPIPASWGPFYTLILNNAYPGGGQAAANVEQDFVFVCTAANTLGVELLGF